MSSSLLWYLGQFYNINQDAYIISEKIKQLWMPLGDYNKLGRLG